MRWLGLVIGALVILGSAISFAAPDLRLSLERSVIASPAGKGEGWAGQRLGSRRKRGCLPAAESPTFSEVS